MNSPKLFENICRQLFKPGKDDDAVFVFDPAVQFEGGSDEPATVARQLNAAFLILLAGPKHPAFEKAQTRLHQLAESAEWSAVAQFYRTAKDHINREIEQVCRQEQDFADRLGHLSFLLENLTPSQNNFEVTEKIWSVFFPEGCGLSSARQQSVNNLREKRSVSILAPNLQPILEPAREIIFTSNVLLTLPPASQSYDTLSCNDVLKQKLRAVSQEPQRYWYDHPIHIGVEPPNNELLYGLRGLEEALAFERDRGSIAKNSRMTWQGLLMYFSRRSHVNHIKTDLIYEVC